MSDQERRTVAIDEAIARLGDEQKIHTFRMVGQVLIGADWSRADLIDAMRRYGVEDSGPGASSMKHTLVLHDGLDYLFIEADPAPTEAVPS